MVLDKLGERVNIKDLVVEWPDRSGERFDATSDLTDDDWDWILEKAKTNTEGGLWQKDWRCPKQ